ncbi:hypothetical protein ACFW1A_04870 [Kitasatospora sp. NPDC058965]|uniref:hypothetical protein n=1 Tax=Kitasatospora sp. NPDC058965 TaxID=3346682 RepID=UPI0036742EAF
MTPDETLRALAALEAGFKRDDQALAALARRAPDEPGLPVLVADFGVLTLDTLVLLASGLAGRPEADEFLRTNVTARMCAALGRTWTGWAAGADDGASGEIARAVIDGILSFTEGAGEQHVLPLLAALRDQALQGD